MGERQNEVHRTKTPYCTSHPGTLLRKNILTASHENPTGKDNACISTRSRTDTAAPFRRTPCSESSKVYELVLPTASPHKSPYNPLSEKLLIAIHISKTTLKRPFYKPPMEPQKLEACEQVEATFEGHSIPPRLAALDEAALNRLGRVATRKLDLAIMPILVIMYILNYLDRQNIASAKLADIEEDLNLSAVQYQSAVSILFAGYILMQLPSNMLISKISRPGAYICLAMAVWGVISACMAAVHNFVGLLMARFFIGFVEAVFFPGALFFLSMFYNRQQFALRTAILYSGSQLGNAFGGLFAIAILNLDGVHGLEGWRWVSGHPERSLVFLTSSPALLD